MISGHPEWRTPPNNGQKLEGRKKLVKITYKNL